MLRIPPVSLPSANMFVQSHGGEINLVISDPCDVSVAQSPPHHPTCAFPFPFLMFSLPTFPSAALSASGMSLLAVPLRQPSTKPSPGSRSSCLCSSPSGLLFQNSLPSNHLKQNTTTRSLFLVFTTPPNPSQASAAAAWQVSLPFSNRCI